MSWQQGKLKRKRGASAGFDISKDLKTLFVPAELPGEDSGEDDNDEAVWYVGDRGDPWLKSALNFSTQRQLEQQFGRMGLGCWKKLDPQ